MAYHLSGRVYISLVAHCLLLPKALTRFGWNGSHVDIPISPIITHHKPEITPFSLYIPYGLLCTLVYKHLFGLHLNGKYTFEYFLVKINELLGGGGGRA